jgi:phosphoribosylformylglycinamidine cyclo-ligase
VTSGAGLRSAYAEAGVNVEAGEQIVDLLKDRLGGRGTADGHGVLTGIGAFASAVALPPGYREPVLVSATDGVGTKTAIASAMGRHDTVGRDLVAMCADDVVCLGARPLLFLDYVAVGRLEPLTVANLVAGIAEGCELAGCDLVGGETAEHPGLMGPDQFDLAGFCLGLVERDDLLDGNAAQAGDVLVGLASSGLHANGYALVRAVLARDAIALDRPYVDVLKGVIGEAETQRVVRDEPDVAAQTIGEVLLTPSRIYAPDVLALRDSLAAAGSPLRGLAHITGGGLPGNVPRALPQGLAARLDTTAWPAPSIFRLFAALGGLDGPQLRATFNAGLGMVGVVPRDAESTAVELLASRGVPAWNVGEVVDASNGARYIENGGAGPSGAIRA